MSASMDNGPGGSEEDSRRVLSTWLDDYIAGRCDRARMHESFLEVCRSNPEAPWDALALLDQYQRRGRVDVAVTRALKAEIAQLVFGVANQTEEPRDPEATLDTTGSRWRKLYAERGSLNEDAAPMEPVIEDPALRRDLDPPTRPPPMARPAAKSSPAARASSGFKPATVGVGDVLRDRYELMELLGKGRAGELYQAFDRHRSHLPSPSCYVAVRILQDATDAQRAAVERQAYDAQSLSHPNIVSVFDLDRHHNVYFVVMELLDGEPLSRVLHRLAGKPMSRERALTIVGAVGSALLHAHQRQVAHGDLKPSNILLTTNGDVKVMEFGFARERSFDQWGGEPMIDASDAKTTAAYASAERVAGEEPQPRDDVYSLACIAYELLSGRHPYGGRSAALARAHGRPPAKISALSLRQWNVLQQALHWNREERRIGVADLLAALGCSDGSSPVALSSTQPPLDNPFGRGKGMVLALLVAATIGGLAWWQWPRLIEADGIRLSPEITDAATDPQQPAARTDGAPVAPEPLPTQADSAPQPSADRGSAKAPAEGVVAATAEPQADNRVADTQASGSQSQARETPSSSAAEARVATGPASIEFDKDTYVATESDAMVTLTVRRNGPTRGSARFRWTLRSNSAEAGADFAAIGPGIEEIPPGSRTLTITIPLVSDSVVENTELFLVELDAVDGGPQIGEHAHAAVILVDDD